MQTSKYKNTEIGPIPEDWEVKSLGEIGYFKNGINKGSSDFGFGYPFVNLMDVFGRNCISGNENFGLINANDAERKIYDLKEGDVLFIRSSVKPTGVGLTCVIITNLPNVVYSGFLLRFRDSSYLDSEFKKHCFYESKFRNRLISQSTVSANTNVNQDSLKKIKIPLPPSLTEQKAIATALSDTDALISSLEQLISKKRAIKQGAMQELLKPKDGDALSLSKGWEVKKLGDVAEIIMGQSPKSQYYNVESIGLPLVQGNADIKERKTIVRNYTSEITRVGKVGDIIMSVRAPVGEVAKATFDCCLGRGVCSIRFKNEFIYYYLLYFENQWAKFSTGSTFDSVNSTQVKELNIPLPSEIEQTQIATILSDMDTEIENLERKLDKYKQIKQGMMQQLLTGKIRLV